MCTEMADNVLLPTVQVARVNRRGEAKRHGGRPHGVFEVVPNAITSQVPPDADPGDDMLLELSANNYHNTGQAIGKPRTRTQPCQTPRHRTIQAATENGVDTAAGASKSSLACVLNSRESGHHRVNHRIKGERSESSRIDQLKVGHRNKGKSGYSRIQHLKRKTTAWRTQNGV